MSNNDKHPLDTYNKIFRTHVGACFPGEKALFRGQDLHQELLPIEWFDLYIYGITGKRFESKKLELLLDLWTYTSYPDGRIWNNRVSALGGSNRSNFSLSLAASLSLSEADLYGSGVSYKCITFLTESLRQIKCGDSLENCIKKELKLSRGIAGYGRPLTAKDERIEPILKKAHSLGLGNGPHLKLAFEVDKFLHDGRWRLRINYAAISAALVADIGLSPMEYYQYAYLAFVAGMPPCYTEATQKPAGAIFPTPCRDIVYTGKKQRKWKGE